MNGSGPMAGPPTARAAWVALGVTSAATATSLLVDRTVYELFNAPGVYDKDLGKLLRVMGFAGTWLFLALAVGLQHDGSEAARTIARRRGWLIFWAPVLSGALAEVLKIVVRRQRPGLNDGAYGFRPWDERTWSGAGLAFPSSHAAVAFGGAFILARLFPRARWVVIVLALGCGVTRIVARAHFVSDVVFAAGLGWLVSWWLWRYRPQAAGSP
ncbi:MAG: phosphatase PAP2 family protein [Gemmatimonadaceae bacterium]|nr:phosphatase PAP2 family protein [Gemmatimonadaceae bacterium]MCW5826547.1 phosphatase PAP2 family protein [Gemmatimonadaceae bacterium]